MDAVEAAAPGRFVQVGGAGQQGDVGDAGAAPVAVQQRVVDHAGAERVAGEVDFQVVEVGRVRAQVSRQGDAQAFRPRFPAQVRGGVQSREHGGVGGQGARTEQGASAGQAGAEAEQGRGERGAPASGLPEEQGAAARQGGGPHPGGEALRGRGALDGPVAVNEDIQAGRSIVVDR